ncbi:NACHT domain-containing protein [Nostoc linckia]|uniref:NACHT domain-containing protein n=1 Tax=Nostoc linckia TaxID=92942 RepID=UPI000BFFFDEE|nr:HEAT repeat domain-containing protein [Nostoc linckia]
MDIHPRLTFLGLLKVSLLGVAFPLLLTSHNWAQANTKQDNNLLYAQTRAQSTPQPTKSGEVKKTNSPPQEKKQEEEEKSDEEKNQDLPWFVLPIGLGVLVVLYGGVLWFRPLWLLWLPAELKIPKMGMLPEFNLPLGFVIWLKYRPRVLDAWVKDHIKTFETEFLIYETVQRRQHYVSLPVEVEVIKESNNERRILTADYLKTTFKKDKRVGLLVSGDGGTGKTTIACQIAKWAMTDDKKERLAEHLMLPVLIEQELESGSGEGIKALMKNFVGQIQKLTDSEQKIVDELLVEQLLRQRRILLIIDRFSEMSQETRDKINPDHPDFPANAIVVTSRIDVKIDVIDIKIKTLRLDGPQLTNFIKEYLIKRNKWELFTKDQDKFLKECAKLAGIVGDKEKIIVLLAKLYAERMINAKENLPGTKRSPDNIPDLILEHLETLNSDVVRRTGEEYHTVQQDAKLIAWQCLQQEYKPNYVDRTSIVAALGEGKADNILEYFEKQLCLIKSGKSHTIKFALDTLAEYLAGLYLVEFYKENEDNWREFIAKIIEKIDPNSDEREEIKGFLLAVRECCITKGGKKVPSFVADELGKLAGLDLEAIEQEKQRQRIDSFIDILFHANSKLGYKEDAIQELQKMAALGDQYALEGLLLSLKIDDINVRYAIVAALGNLGDISEPVLIELLALVQNKNEEDDVRRNAVVALGKLHHFGLSLYIKLGIVFCVQILSIDLCQSFRKKSLLANASEPLINGLLELLLDQEQSAMHNEAAAALHNIRNVSRLVDDKLLEYLQDKDVDVRRNAAKALSNYLSNASKPVELEVLNGLLERLQDRGDDVVVRRNVAEALGNYLSNASKPVELEVLNRLLERLQDRGDDVVVRRNAAEALGNYLSNAFEPVELEVLNGLLERLQDKGDDVVVRRNAAEALGNLRNTSKQVLDELLARSKDANEQRVVLNAARKAFERLKG